MKEEKYLFSLQNRGIKLGLERTKRLLKACGSPHKKIKIIQILGTNGKGSTSAILSNILKHNNCRVGLYTSPHLFSFTERVRINGRAIDLTQVKQFLNQYKSVIEKLEASFFEVMTVMAVWYFNNYQTDYAIMETGLGGKYDSVTACSADIFGITSISKDHQNILGTNLKDITNEKIAAIKKNSLVWSVNQKTNINKIINDHCIQSQCTYKKIKTDFSLNVSLPGNHQKENASLAISIATHILPELKNINKSLLSTKWFGRNQIIQKSPHIIFDVAHNEDGIKSFLKFIDGIKDKFKQKYLLLSIQKTKNINNISLELSQYFDYIFYTVTDKEKSMDFKAIKSSIANAIFIENPTDAINHLVSIATKEDLISIIGSHFWGETISNKFNISFDNL